METRSGGGTKETNLDEMAHFGRSGMKEEWGGSRGSVSLHLSSTTDLVLHLSLFGSSRCINRQEEHTARVQKRETSGGGEGLV